MGVDRDSSPAGAGLVAVGGLIFVALNRRPARDVGALRQAVTAARPTPKRRRVEAPMPATTAAAKPGWWGVIRGVGSQVIADRLLTEAAAVTFFTLLALFPALAASLSIYGLFADPTTMWAHIEGLAGVIPDGGLQLLREQNQRLTAQPQEALGLGVLIGLAVSLWSANQAVSALVDSLNVVYERTETRGIVKLRLWTLAMTIGAILFLLVAVAAVVAVPVVLGLLGLAEETDLIVRLARWPVLLLGAAALFALLYRFGPDRPRAHWRWITRGSLLAAFLWICVSVGFSWYVASFGSYDETYGSLGAVVGFMTWIWLSATVVLIGAELDAQLEVAAP